MGMTRAELEALHESMCQQARATQSKKNHDYATEADIFRNFRYFGGLGILVRMSDKLARLRSFEENGVFKVEDEKLVDTIQDLINYAVIYLAFKQEGAATSFGNLAGRPKVEVGAGPYCKRCDKLADVRLDKNNEEEVYYCSPCAEIVLPVADFCSLTYMEPL